VLLLRDILDGAESTQRVWRKNGYFEAISAYYHQVLVVGSPEVFDLRREYAFPPFAAAKVQFCGYIARQRGRQPREAVRTQLDVAAGAPLVLVTPGGGEDGFQLIHTTLQALAGLPPADCPRTHIVCGPELDDGRRAQVHQAAARLPRVSVQDFSDDMMSLMAAADVVLAMGGYNTVCELLTLHKRALLVPRIKPGVEQLIRAERMAALGLLHMIHPDRLSPASLLAGLRAEIAALGRHGTPPALRHHDGLARVTAALFEAIGLPQPTTGTAAASTLPATPQRREAGRPVMRIATSPAPRNAPAHGTQGAAW